MPGTQVERRLIGLETKARQLERQMDIAKQRELQLIVMLKMLLEKCVHTERVRGEDIYKTLESFLSKNIPEEHKDEPADLIAELVKKGKL